MLFSIGQKTPLPAIEEYNAWVGYQCFPQKHLEVGNIVPKADLSWHSTFLLDLDTKPTGYVTIQNPDMSEFAGSWNLVNQDIVDMNETSLVGLSIGNGSP